MINRKAPNGMLRPLINLVQQLTVMLAFNAPFPKALTDLYKVLAGLSVGVEVVSPQCAGVGSTCYSLRRVAIPTADPTSAIAAARWKPPWMPCTNAAGPA